MYRHDAADAINYKPRSLPTPDKYFTWQFEGLIEHDQGHGSNYAAVTPLLVGELLAECSFEVTGISFRVKKEEK